MMERSPEVRAAVDELVALASLNSVRLVDRIADVFDSPELRDEFLTGAMTAAILRDAVEPLRAKLRGNPDGG